jgi:hypothetical protein
MMVNWEAAFKAIPKEVRDWLSANKDWSFEQTQPSATQLSACIIQLFVQKKSEGAVIEELSRRGVSPSVSASYIKLLKTALS